MSLVNSRRYVTVAGPTVTHPQGSRPEAAGGLPYPNAQQVCEFLIVSSWLTLTRILDRGFHSRTGRGLSSFLARWVGP
jgi:hypothetical protein